MAKSGFVAIPGDTERTLSIKDNKGRHHRNRGSHRIHKTSGFWQIRLDDTNSKLSIFNTPLGRYSFTILPFGINSGSEVYQRQKSELVHGIDGCEAIIDDILVWGRDLEEHDRRLSSVLDKVRHYNLKLNPEKCKFRKDCVTYVGHELTSAGVRPDKEKVRAVMEMNKPTCAQELQSTDFPRFHSVSLKV